MRGIDVRGLRERYRLTVLQVAERAGLDESVVLAAEDDGSAASSDRALVLRAIGELARPSDGLTRHVRSQILDAFGRAGGSDVRLFGSVARGQDRAGSDIDFLATFPPNFSLFAMNDLQDELEAITGVAVDVVSYDGRAGRVMDAVEASAVPFTLDRAHG